MTITRNLFEVHPVEVQSRVLVVQTKLRQWATADSDRRFASTNPANSVGIMQTA